jgi:hypothetical protein
LAAGAVPAIPIDVAGGGYTLTFPAPGGSGATPRKGEGGSVTMDPLPLYVTMAPKAAAGVSKVGLLKRTTLLAQVEGAGPLGRNGARPLAVTFPDANTLSFARGQLARSGAADPGLVNWLRQRAGGLLRR